MNDVVRKNDFDLAIPLDTSAKLLCPVCQFDYVHLRRVSVLQGTQRTIVERTVDRVEEVPEHAARGSIITIECDCEDGHVFDLHIWFHKGATHLSTTFIRNVQADKDGMVVERTEELWRD